MAKVHGKKGIIYLGETTAVKIANLNNWSVEVGSALSEDTDFDSGGWEETLKGVNNWSGSLAGFHNDLSKELFTAATSGNVQRLYLYPIADSTAKYFYGTVYPDFSIEVVSSDVVKVSGAFKGTGALGHNLA